jgi:hypothetical protein
MSEIDDGGAAFPCHTNPMPGKLANAPQGMTLRDYFAAAALQGIITKGTYSSVAMMSCGKSFDYERLAYIVADRMLAARKEGA